MGYPLWYTNQTLADADSQKGHLLRVGQSIHGKESNLIVSWHCTFHKSKRRFANKHNSNHIHSQEFFRAIRKDSTAIYAYLGPLEFSLVANRDEVYRMVKEEERKRRKREKKKANKELEKEAEARLNEERERLETERKAEASLNLMEGLGRTIDAIQITLDSEAFITPFPLLAKTCTQEQHDKVARHIAHLPYLREEETVLLRELKIRM